MVARGDLGVELPLEDVPVVQRKIIRKARILGKPVIVATHMLESMIDSPTPTRAEASDVATAIYQGADVVMLSAETAVGRHPATAVAIMDRIIKSVESDPEFWDYFSTVIYHILIHLKMRFPNLFVLCLKHLIAKLYLVIPIQVQPCKEYHEKGLHVE